MRLGHERQLSEGPRGQLPQDGAGRPGQADRPDSDRLRLLPPGGESAGLALPAAGQEVDQHGHHREVPPCPPGEAGQPSQGTVGKQGVNFISRK